MKNVHKQQQKCRVEPTAETLFKKMFNMSAILMDYTF